MSPNRSARPEPLERSKTQVLLIDVQDRILPQIDGHGSVLARCRTLIRAAAALDLPVAFTEHYPAGLGATEPALAADLEQAGALRLEKITFSAYRTTGVSERLHSLRRPHVLVAGIETHVCVQQTVLDMLRGGLEPVLLADAVGSRYALDHETALASLRHAGVWTTTVEAVLFELLERAGTDLFRAVLPLLREPRPGG